MGTLETDEAVWGLMARHFLQGELSPFFWDQTYGGTQETTLTAIVFKIAGSSITTLRLVPLALYAVSAWLLWRVGLRTVGDRAALIGTVLFAIAPAWLIYKSTRAHGFYGFTMVVGLAILLAVLRLRNRTSWLEAGWLGLLIGVGWWASPQIVLIAAPALLWLFVRKPSILRTTPLVLATACVGAAPWIVDNINHHWHSLDPPSAAPPDSTYGDHLGGFFQTALPSGLGLRAGGIAGSQEWVIPAVVGWPLYAGLIAGFIWLLIKRPKPVELLLAVAVPYPFIVAASEFAYYVLEPRYVHLLLPIIALLGAYALSQLRTSFMIGGLVAVLLLCVAGLPGTMNADVGPKLDFSSAVEELRARDVDRGFAEYELAYPITFVADEDVIVTSSGHVRYPPHDHAVRAHPNPSWVFGAGSPRDAVFAEALEALGVPYQRVETEDLIIYFPASVVHPEVVPGAR